MKATLGVRELVLDGELSPGDRVPEIALAQRLGVSRTPLRIALTTLAHEGLLESLRGGGFVVRSFTRADIADAIELRGVLEGLAARLAAERLRTHDDAARLAETTARLDEVVDDLSPDALARYVELNDGYHRELVALAGSEVIARAIANVVVLPFAAPGAFVASQAVLPRSREILVVAQHQHRALLHAVRTRQGARAEEIAREHARLALQNLDLVLDDRVALGRLQGAPLLARVV
jgi:GntR family transcriptional regulator of vanillate catabolism